MNFFEREIFNIHFFPVKHDSVFSKNHALIICLIAIYASNNELRKEICLNYLEGLEWTFKYYTQGCVNWRWYYHFNYPPLLTDLLHYIPIFSTSFLNNNLTNTQQLTSTNPINELVQLCYVLPRSSLYLLPNELKNYLLTHHSNWYKTDCDFIWAYCNYFWESYVDLPYININELENIIRNI